jgi:hypothetical protein
MSSKNKKFIKKTGTVVPVNSTASPFAQFPRIVTASGTISPNPAMTISEGFRHQAEQAELNAPLKAKHADVRAQIIRCISGLPGAPTALVLTGLSSIKLAQQALKWFTAENPHGIFGSDDNVVHVEQLLLELQLSAPSSISRMLSIVASTLHCRLLTLFYLRKLCPKIKIFIFRRCPPLQLSLAALFFSRRTKLKLL